MLLSSSKILEYDWGVMSPLSWIEQARLPQVVQRVPPLLTLHDPERHETASLAE